MTRRTILLPLVVGIAAILGGCAAPAPDDGRIDIVAVTDVYADIARTVGGDRVDVTAIVAGTTQDPHSYEASARDQLAVAEADLIVVNGGGYDDFMTRLIEASGTTAPVIVAAEVAEHVDLDELAEEAHEEEHEGEEEHGEEDEHAHIEGFNEHVWYDLHGMEHVAEEVARLLAELDPAGAIDFEAGAAAFATEIDALLDETAAIAEIADGAPVLITEPVPGYLLLAAGFADVTPPEFSEAIEEGGEVSVALQDEVLGLVSDGGLRLVAYNSQTAGPETELVLAAASEAGVPVVSFTETLPDGRDYLSWMRANLEAIRAALG